MKLHPYFSFIKACHHLSLSWSNICTCICYEVASSFAFVMKLHQYSSFIIKLPWHFICIEATPILIFAMKPRQHFIHTKAVSSFIFAMKPHQHFIHTEAMSSFIFAIKPRQHSTLALKPCQLSSLSWSNIYTYICYEVAQSFRGNIAQTLRMHSTVAKH